MTVDEVMAERAHLIGKKFGEGLSKDEAARLESLNKEASRLCPRVTKEMLQAMEETASKYEDLARQIDELLRAV